MTVSRAALSFQLSPLFGLVPLNSSFLVAHLPLYRGQDEERVCWSSDLRGLGTASMKKKRFLLGIARMMGGGTLGQHWLLKQFCLNHPVEHIQKPKLPKLYVRVESSTSYFIIHNQFVK